jgi:hypothetical protein
MKINHHHNYSNSNNNNNLYKKQLSLNLQLKLIFQSKYEFVNTIILLYFLEGDHQDLLGKGG